MLSPCKQCSTIFFWLQFNLEVTIMASGKRSNRNRQYSFLVESQIWKLYVHRWKTRFHACWRYFLSQPGQTLYHRWEGSHQARPLKIHTNHRRQPPTNSQEEEAEEAEDTADKYLKQRRQQREKNKCMHVWHERMRQARNENNYKQVLFWRVGNKKRKARRSNPRPWHKRPAVQKLPGGKGAASISNDSVDGTELRN